MASSFLSNFIFTTISDSTFLALLLVYVDNVLITRTAVKILCILSSQSKDSSFASSRDHTQLIGCFSTYLISWNCNRWKTPRRPWDLLTSPTLSINPEMFFYQFEYYFHLTRIVVVVWASSTNSRMDLDVVHSIHSRNYCCITGHDL